MKFSIITPAYNGERFVRETIESVLSQEGDFEIEYILADGGSTDSTVAIFNEYKARNTDPRITMLSFSKKDQGMYDAINKGFARATGDVYAWINSDDAYLPGAFAEVAAAFASPTIEWLIGPNVVVNEVGHERRGKPLTYHQSWIKRGIYGRYAPFITQESVFWRKSLWEKVGPIDNSLRFAGDYWLWIHFAQYAALHTISTPLACFRRRSDSLSNQEGGSNYRAEQAKIMPPQGTLLEFGVKLFYWIKNRIQ